MNMIIYKYPLEIKDEQIIKLPNDYIILDIEFQNIMEPMLWAMINQENKPEDVTIRIFGTGQEFQYNYGMVHIKTIHGNAGTCWHQTWHIFEDRR